MTVQCCPWRYCAVQTVQYNTVQSGQHITNEIVQPMYISNRYTVHGMRGYGTVGSVFYRSIVQYSRISVLQKYNTVQCCIMQYDV